MIKTIHSALADGLSSVEQQLGYLLLTGSSENFIRDMLASELQKGYRTARDYRWHGQVVDIVLFDRAGDQPFSCIELKQLYLKDLQSGPRNKLAKRQPRYFKNLMDDMGRRRKVCQDVYGVVLTREIPVPPKSDAERFRYVQEDANSPGGVADIHGYLVDLSVEKVIETVFPRRIEHARVVSTGCDGAEVNLYGWVVKAR